MINIYKSIYLILIITTISISSQATSKDIIINEFNISASPVSLNKYWLELYNHNENSINLSGWAISNRSTNTLIQLPNWEIPSDSYLVVIAGFGTNDNDFSDGSGSYYIGWNECEFNISDDECALYQNANNLSSIKDFISWGNLDSYSGGAAYQYAIKEGIWSTGDYLEILKCIDDFDIGRDKRSNDNDSSSDWLQGGGINAFGSTPGKRNDAFNDEDQCISGFIFDKEGAPISGANIKILGTLVETNSDSNGYYIIKGAPVGLCNMSFTRQNYVPNYKYTSVFRNNMSYLNANLINRADSVSIGPNGGTIRKDNGLCILIPEGALNSTTEISITLLPPEANPITADDSRIPACSIYLQPENLSFNKPITITFPLSYLGDNALDFFEVSAGDPLSVQLYDPIKFTWISYTNATINNDRKNATMQISHFSTFSPTISGYRIEKTRDIVPLTEYDYLMNCACNPGGDTGINSDCSYNNERSLSVTISGSVSAGLKDVIEASVGTSIGKSVTVTWHHGLRSDNCHDNELYGRWKGNRYHVSIWRNFWPFGEMYLGSFTVDEPTGPEFDTRMKKEFKKNCDKCCRECAPKEISRSNSELVPPKEPCTPSTSGDNCYISGGSITENLNDVPGEQEKKWLDACKEEVKIKHNVDGTISSNGDEYCRCDENSAYEYAGPVSCDKTYHGSYTETVIFDYLAGTCPS